jgi:phosphatidylserine/phosphatidylglycerophosphate/cardiolipin synthase-like enzyme
MYNVFMKTTNFGVRLMAENVTCIATPLPGNTYIVELIKSILNTKYSLDVIQYQWNFYPQRTTCEIQKLNRTILGKVQGGIKCRVLLNQEGSAEHLRAINMKAGRFLREAGILVKFGRSSPIIHSKLFIIDDDITILGSHNLSNRSVSVNVETSILINSREITQEYKRYFNTLWNLL